MAFTKNREKGPTLEANSHLTPENICSRAACFPVDLVRRLSGKAQPQGEGVELVRDFKEVGLVDIGDPSQGLVQFSQSPVKSKELL